ncbi:MAG: F0F1 ATP synthase subunit A [Oscillospiraceae bacterium]|nr:F0F1 ATP synthase subunit A [Oscillospiraceae bacterium]
MDFNNKVLHVFHLFGVEIWLTQTIVNTWAIMAALTLFALAVRILLRRFKPVPAGFQNAVELAVEAFGSVVRNAVGEKYMYLGNWFFMVFAFILASNLSGVLGLRPPTADFATTFALALATFVLIQVIGFTQRKGKYLKSFFEPIFIFFPLNLLGELARPVSLSFRLFGNVLAGMILLGLVYQLPIYLRFVIPAAAHAIFDVFFGALQTYVFCVLSLSFIGAAAKQAGE